MPKAPPTNHHEAKLRKAGHRLIAGVDEAGKGSWAGPLVTAAVILDETDIPVELYDSKMLTPMQRERAFVTIARKALAWTAHVVPVTEIDREGVHKANLAALKRAVEKLHVSPDAVLVDAFKIDLGATPVVNIIDGDALERSISAASIVAKVVRDQIMSSELHRQYPHFHFHVHKGYGTPLHAKLLAMHGPTLAHRMSFAPVQAAAQKSSKDFIRKKMQPTAFRKSKPVRQKPARIATRAPKKRAAQTKRLKKSIKKKATRAKQKPKRARR
jgi:ribonuclease HII